ncbi:hypothetical protein HMF7854_05475 [Sphingomonas ginkgonis]|uniref:Uncharacterized protein n=2 Tax=Sphingomonas ginkgonis TaxID=2315330 RepID=A0A3R9WSC4_9SPHN|nr:hypothetical protein HMF7854_05475 [Sphingomonas ginkgonis]
MQRIRAGLTGLAIVFLFVMLGTAISGSSENSAAPTPNVAGPVAEPNEPLAELGVAPGETSTDNSSKSAAGNAAAGKGR